MKPSKKQKPQPREKYDFHLLKVNEYYKFLVPDDEPKAGTRALCAAYAYGRRNGQQFCGATDVRGKKTYMLIRRVK